MVCLALKLIGSWVLVGFSVGMDVLDGLLLVKISCSQEFSGVLRLGQNSQHSPEKKTGTEYWILKCPQFISYNEKQRLKI